MRDGQTFSYFNYLYIGRYFAGLHDLPAVRDKAKGE
jgi:hypothetical protein